MMLYLFGGLAVLVLVVLIVGYSLPAQRVFEKQAVINADVATVFQCVTDVARQPEWRSDVKEIVVHSDTSWTEVPVKGSPITFSIQKRIDNQVFQIEIVPPTAFKGLWEGSFAPTANGGTTVTFREVVEIQHPIFRVLSALFFDLNATMDKYISDLRMRTERA